MQPTWRWEKHTLSWLKSADCWSLESTFHGALDHVGWCSVAWVISVGIRKISLPLRSQNRGSPGIQWVKQWQPASRILGPRNWSVSDDFGFHCCLGWCVVWYLCIPSQCPPLCSWHMVQLPGDGDLGMFVLSGTLLPACLEYWQGASFDWQVQQQFLVSFCWRDWGKLYRQSTSGIQDWGGEATRGWKTRDGSKTVCGGLEVGRWELACLIADRGS